MEARLEHAVARATRQARAVVLLLIWTSGTAFLAGLLLAGPGAAGIHPIGVVGISLALAAGASAVASAASDVLWVDRHPTLARPDGEVPRPGA